MKNPLISFIIPFYNVSAQQLKDSIDSIIALSLQSEEREIIVVDDGSNGKEQCPVNLLLDYSDDIIFIRKSQSGASDARNMGLRMATGKYIQFVNGGDRLIPSSYEQCLDVARFKEPDMVMFCTTSNPDHESDILPADGPVSGTEYMLKNKITSAVWRYIFKSGLLMNLQFDSDVMNGDYVFTPQLMIRCDRVFSLKSKAYCHLGYMPWADYKVERKDRLDEMHDSIVNLRAIADVMPASDRQAMNRRVAELTMAYISAVITMTKSHSILNERLEQLTKEGLFPLPDRKYTKRYQLFRKMIGNKVGREILFHTLPLMKGQN